LQVFLNGSFVCRQYFVLVLPRSSLYNCE